MWRSSRVLPVRSGADRGPGSRSLPGDLFVEWYGGGVAVSHRDDQPFLLWQLLSTVYPPSPDLPVLYTPAALAHPAAATVLQAVTLEAAETLNRRGGGRIVLGPFGASASTDAELITRLRALVPVPFAEPAVPAVPRPPAVFAAGWQRETDRLYRHGEPPLAVAEVLPAGILLRPDQVYAAGAVAVFEPPVWTFVVGSPGQHVPPDLVAMVRRILLDAGAEPVPPRLEVAGVADEETRREIASLAEELTGRAPDPPADAVGPAVLASVENVWPPEEAVVADEGACRSLGEPVLAGRDAVVAGQAAFWPPEEAVVAEESAFWSPGEAVVAGPEADRPPTGAPRGHDERAPRLSSPPPLRLAPSPVVTIVDPDLDAPGVGSWPPPNRATPNLVTSVDPAPTVAADPEEARIDAPDSVDAPRWRPAAAQSVADRASSEQEQQGFAAALGRRFTDLLAVVNAAMATWPVLRRDATVAAKADFVAVCLYLGASPDGAVGLNRALRRGEEGPLAGYVACLVSGLLQLPLHRRPVLCQARLGQPAPALYPVGSVVTEPGFLSASAAGDITVPGADVDFLLLPRSARQVSVLTPGREVDEVVFSPGRRFRVLAVHDGQTEAPDKGVAAPPTAVLLRELAPNEQPAGPDLAEADRAALARLESLLAQRRATGLRVIDDPDLVARLAGAPPGYWDASARDGEVGAS